MIDYYRNRSAGTYGQQCISDVGSETALLDQVVVDGIGAAERDTSNGDRLAGTDVLVGKGAHWRAADGYAVAAQCRRTSSTRERGGCAAVINFVTGGKPRDAQVGLADVGSKTALLDQVVVDSISTGDGVAGDSDGFVVSRCLVGK